MNEYMNMSLRAGCRGSQPHRDAVYQRGPHRSTTSSIGPANGWLWQERPDLSKGNGLNHYGALKVPWPLAVHNLAPSQTLPQGSLQWPVLPALIAPSATTLLNCAEVV